MKAVLIRFAFALMLPGVVFSGQQSENWWQSKIYGLKKAAAEKAESWWYGRKKQTDIVSPFQKGIEGATTADQIAKFGLISGATGISKDIIDALVSPFPLLQGMQKGGMILPMSMLAGLFVVGFAIQKVIVSYRAHDIKKEVAISRIKDIISIELTNVWAYPTRSTKINALLKKNEFVVDIRGLDEEMKKELDKFMTEACNQLIGDISKKRVVKEDKIIDEEISKLRVQLLAIPMLDKKIEFIQNLTLKELDVQQEIVYVGDILNVIADPKIMAANSEVIRLTKQKIFEELYKEKSQITLREEIMPAARARVVEKLRTENLGLEGKKEVARKAAAGIHRAEYVEQLKEKRRVQ